MSNQPLRVASVFSGCGGADLGALGGFTFLGKRYSKLNTEIVHASDIDERAVATYNENFRHEAEVADIRGLTFPQDSADVVIGGFPCQSFSTVNPTKDPLDDRGQLYRELARVVGEARPLAFVAENVRGFYTLRGGHFFRRASEAFESAGPGYTLSHQLINAADFGVPQLRKRLFIVGIRKDAGMQYHFPAPTHSEEGFRGKAWVPLRSVIGSLEPEDPRYFFSQRAVDGVKRAKPNMKRAVAQDLASPCLTITSHLAKVSLNSRDPVLLVDAKNERYRRFTPREAARIQSFPESFSFPGTEGDAYRQIGNAIAPVVAWHLIRSLGRQLRQLSGDAT